MWKGVLDMGGLDPIASTGFWTLECTSQFTVGQKIIGSV
jgi:hypothetical protein